MEKSQKSNGDFVRLYMDRSRRETYEDDITFAPRDLIAAAEQGTD